MQSVVLSINWVLLFWNINSLDNAHNRWFAKRFLHPDIVAEYAYIFLWDEDLGIEHFHPERYEHLIS